MKSKKAKFINKSTLSIRNYLRKTVDYPETCYNLLHLSVCARKLDSLLDEKSYLYMAPDEYIEKYRNLVCDIRETYNYLYSDLERSGFIDEFSVEDLPF